MIKALLAALALNATHVFAGDNDPMAELQRVCKEAFNHPIFWWGGFQKVKFEPEDLLPEWYVTELKKIGEVSVKTKSTFMREDLIAAATSDIAVIRLTIEVDGTAIFTLKFGRSLHDMSTLYIDGLAAHDPTDRINKYRHALQEDCGLPFDVFMSITKNLRQWAKNEGVEKIRTSGADNYLVMKLYQRYFGFRPANADAQRIVDDTESIYNTLLRRHLKTLKRERRELNRLEFAYMLGLYRDHSLPDNLSNLWEAYLKSGKSENNGVLQAESGTKYFVGILKDETPTLSRIDDSVSPPRLLRWRDLDLPLEVSLR